MALGKDRSGFSVVELMTTLAIVAVLATTAGVLFAKLLSIRERDREEGYVRERLAEVCGSYADILSIGSSIINTGTNTTIVKYRQETGGVSLETGVVTRVAYLAAGLNVTNRMMDVDVYSIQPGATNINEVIARSVSRRASGDAAFIPMPGEIVGCTLTPLAPKSTVSYSELGKRDASLCANMVPGATFSEAKAALGLLTVRARYKVEDEDGKMAYRYVAVERVVRLWNSEN